jgi:hypothetical protein
MQGVIQLRPRFFSLKPSGWPVPGLVSGRIFAAEGLQIPKQVSVAIAPGIVTKDSQIPPCRNAPGV